MAQMPPPQSTTPPGDNGVNVYPIAPPTMPEPGSVHPGRAPRSLPQRRILPKLGDLGLFWECWHEATDQYDRDILDALKSNMDNLLIFAALFSAVNSAVLALSVPVLSAAPGDETNRLLRLLIQGRQGMAISPEDLDPPSFIPSRDVVRINQLFSVSLTCSMLAAFGALLGQQWITSYRRRPAGGFEEERRERQRRLLGAKRWRLELVLELILPMLLQISLVVFMAGMASYLRTLSAPVALPNIILSWMGAAFFVLTIIFAVSDPHCPFKTPYSEIAEFIVVRLVKWYRDHKSTTWHLPLRRSFRGTRISQKTREYKREWFLRQWPNDVLEGDSVQRILSTSANSKTLREMALNIPLIQNNHSLDAISSDNIAMSHLYHLYEIYSVQTNEDEIIYSTAICHLVLASQNHNYERTNHILRGHELQVIHSAAQGHVSRPDSPVSVLPSSIITVALAYLLSDPADTTERPTRDGDLHERSYTQFLHRSIHSTATPHLPVTAMAWILVSSPRFLPDHARRRATLEAVGCAGSPPDRLQSGDSIFHHASEAYHKFYKSSTSDSHWIPDAALRCIAEALQSQHAPTETARPLLSRMLDGLAYMADMKTQARRASNFLPVVEALYPLLADDEIGLPAAKALCSLLNQLKPRAGFELGALAIPAAAIDALKAYAQNHADFLCIQDHLPPPDDPGTL